VYNTDISNYFDFFWWD